MYNRTGRPTVNKCAYGSKATFVASRPPNRELTSSVPGVRHAAWITILFLFLKDPVGVSSRIFAVDLF